MKKPRLDIPCVSKVTLIRVEHLIGEGVEGDPVRVVTDYYTEDGDHFKRDDPYPTPERAGRE